MSKKELLDKLQGKFVSRKLLVFVVACFGLFSGNITSADWVVVATSYIAVQSVVDAVEKLFKAKNNNDNVGY
jgi:hypothetical protein